MGAQESAATVQHIAQHVLQPKRPTTGAAAMCLQERCEIRMIVPKNSA